MQKTEKAALVSAVCTGTLSGGMIAVSVITGSVSVLAKAIDSITDTVKSASVLFGLRLSERHSRKFPLGLHKLENVIATGIGLLILFGAYELAREAIVKISSGQSGLESAGIILAVMSVVVVASALLAVYKGKVGREANSPSLIADAKESWLDILSSVVVMVGVGLESAGIPYMDSIAALVIVVFLVYAGGSIALDGLKVLLDASIEKDVLKEVESIAGEDPGVRDVLSVIGRNSGRYRFLDLRIVPATRDLEEAARTANRLEAEIRDSIDNVDEVRIELDVEEKRSLLCAVPLGEDGVSVSEHFGEAPFLEMVSIKLPECEVVSREKLDNPYLSLERGKGVRVSELLVKKGADVLITREPLDRRGAFYVLQAHNVKIISDSEVLNETEAEKELCGYANEFSTERSKSSENDEEEVHGLRPEPGQRETGPQRHVEEGGTVDER